MNGGRCRSAGGLSTGTWGHAGPVRILGSVLLALLVLVAAGGCAAEDPSAAATDYSSPLQAPTPGDFTASDVTPDAEEGLQQLTLDDGSRVVVWIDPEDIAVVRVQHSDPDGTGGPGGGWSAPQTIHDSGDGCLLMDAATDGRVVALTLGCYATDAFVQQAPDQCAALVSTDLTTWETQDDLLELTAEPQVLAGGDVEWVEDAGDDPVLRWSAEDGFTQG